MKSGQIVTIHAGPFSGLQGILAYCKGYHRLVVFVSLLQRFVAVELDASWVKPIDLEPSQSVGMLAQPRPA